MEVRQIFLKSSVKDALRQTKKKKKMKVMTEKELFFKCQKELGQATL